MKSRRSILILLVLLAVAGGLAWAARPKENLSAALLPTVKSTAPLHSTIKTTIGVEQPKSSPTPASNAAPTVAEDMSIFPLDMPAYSSDVFTPSPTDQYRTDLGEVAITDGVQIRGSLATGDSYVINPTVIPSKNGAPQIMLICDITSQSGGKMSGPKITVEAGTSFAITLNPSSKAGYAISFAMTPYLAGQPPPSTHQAAPSTDPFVPRHTP